MNTVVITLELESGVDMDAISRQMGWNETHRSGSFLTGQVAVDATGAAQLERRIEWIPGVRSARVVGDRFERHWWAGSLGWMSQKRDRIEVSSRLQAMEIISGPPFDILLSQPQKIRD